MPFGQEPRSFCKALIGPRHGVPVANPFWPAVGTPAGAWGVAVSADRLYGFERFILQSVQSGHVKMTFERKGQRDPLLR
jgi:hypothetical protein